MSNPSEPPHGGDPPSHLRGFTVDSGFSVIPAKRPRAVTAASWMMFVYAGLALLGTGVMVVDAITGPGLGTQPLFRIVVDLLRSALMIGLVLALLLAAVGTRQGRDAARVTGFVVVGGAGFVAVMLGMRSIAHDLFFRETGRFDGMELLVASLVFGTAATTVVLLATPRADTWFHEQRGDKYLNPENPDVRRPRGPAAAAALLVLIAVLELAVLVFRFLEGAPGSTERGFAEHLFMFSPDTLPIVLAAVITAVLITRGNDITRIIAFGLCGLLISGLLTALISLLSILGSSSTSNATTGYFFDVATTPAQGVLAVVVIMSLGRGPVAAWFHKQRTD
ncbi:MAG: hypothetical protein ACRD0P_03105 [Stackebrandtia sp.]